jgi:hypothetical protein
MHEETHTLSRLTPVMDINVGFYREPEPQQMLAHLFRI